MQLIHLHSWNLKKNPFFSNGQPSSPPATIKKGAFSFAKPLQGFFSIFSRVEFHQTCKYGKYSTNFWKQLWVRSSPIAPWNSSSNVYTSPMWIRLISLTKNYKTLCFGRRVQDWRHCRGIVHIVRPSGYPGQKITKDCAEARAITTVKIDSVAAPCLCEKENQIGVTCVNGWHDAM